MTLEKAKHKIAVKNGFSDWSHLLRTVHGSEVYDYEQLAIRLYVKMESIAFANFLSDYGNPESIPVEALYDRFIEMSA